jgi:glycosyltransferase involved in cell wall biosynthesis
MKPIDVILANRRRGLFWSIEELFSNIAVGFPEWVKGASASAPSVGANLRAIVANLLWAVSLKNCDLIHQTGDIHYAVLGIWRCPVVLTIHDLRFIEESRGLKRLLFWWWWLYLPCLRANRVTVISEFTRNRLLAVCRVNPRKIKVISNCVSADFQAAPRPWPIDAPRILLVGTTDNKNVTRVLEACSGLDVRLCILGKPTETQRIQLAQQGVNHEVHQGLSTQEVVELYKSCDLICFVSTYEGFGMPILEAQAIGRPVLTSDLSPMREVAREGALKVDPLNVVSIRNGLKRLLAIPELRNELVKKGFENVKNYSATAIAAQYAEVYREVLDKP